MEELRAPSAAEQLRLLQSIEQAEGEWSCVFAVPELTSVEVRSSPLPGERAGAAVLECDEQAGTRVMYVRSGGSATERLACPETHYQVPCRLNLTTDDGLLSEQVEGSAHVPEQGGARFRGSVARWTGTYELSFARTWVHESTQLEMVFPTRTAAPVGSIVHGGSSSPVADEHGETSGEGILVEAVNWSCSRKAEQG